MGDEEIAYEVGVTEGDAIALALEGGEGAVGVVDAGDLGEIGGDGGSDAVEERHDVVGGGDETIAVGVPDGGDACGVGDDGIAGVRETQGGEIGVDVPMDELRREGGEGEEGEEGGEEEVEVFQKLKS